MTGERGKMKGEIGIKRGNDYEVTYVLRPSVGIRQDGG